MKDHKSSFNFYFYGFGVAVLVVSIIFSEWIRKNEDEFIHKQIYYEAELVKTSLEARLSALSKSLKIMAATSKGFRSEKNLLSWRKDIQQYLVEFHGMESVMLLTTDMGIHDVVSERNVDELIGTNLGDYPVIRNVIENAAYNYQVVYGDSYFPLHSGNYFFGVVPITNFDQIDGYIVTFINVESWLESGFDKKDYSVNVSSSGKSRFFIGKPGLTSKTPIRVTTDLREYGLDWKMDFYPTELRLQRQRSPLPHMLLIFGVMTAGLLIFSSALILLYRRQSQALSRSKNKLSAVVHALPDNIFVIDQAESIGKTVKATIEESVVRRLIQGDESKKKLALSGEEKKQFELVDPQTNNEYEARVAPLEDNKRLLVLRDISQAKKLQRSLDEIKLHNIQAARLTEMAEVVGGLAHEINNPLAIIQGHVFQMHRNINPFNSAKIKEGIEKIEKSASRISRILEGIKLFAADDVKEPLNIVSIDEIIGHVKSLCSQRLQNGSVPFAIRVSAVNMELECVKSQIVRVLVNLVNNAFDAVELLAEKWIDVSVNEVAEHIEFSVTDSGKGIPEEVRRKLMTPFFTTKEVGKGTGLGLSIARGVAKGHRGKLYVDENSVNTRFVFSIPKSVTNNSRLRGAS